MASDFDLSKFQVVTDKDGNKYLECPQHGAVTGVIKTDEDLESLGMAMYLHDAIQDHRPKAVQEDHFVIP